jgi:predicted Zn-dependent peptidase
MAVKREEIQAVARKYLRTEKRAIVFRKPVHAGAKEAA